MEKGIEQHAHRVARLKAYEAIHGWNQISFSRVWLSTLFPEGIRAIAVRRPLGSLGSAGIGLC